MTTVDIVRYLCGVLSGFCLCKLMPNRRLREARLQMRGWRAADITGKIQRLVWLEEILK